MASQTTPITKIPHNELTATLRSLEAAGGTTAHADWMRKPGTAQWLVAIINERLHLATRAHEEYPLNADTIARVRPGDMILFRDACWPGEVQMKLVRRAVNGMLHLDLSREPGRLTTHPITGEVIIYCWTEEGLSQMRPSVLRPVPFVPERITVTVLPAAHATEPAVEE